MPHQQRWTLNILATAGLLAGTVLSFLICAGAVVCVAVTPTSLFQTTEDKPLAIVGSCLTLVNLILVSFPIVGYIKVSFGKARPVQMHIYMMVVTLCVPGQSLTAMGAMLLFHKIRMVELAWLLNCVQYVNFGIKKTIFYLLVKQKLGVFVRSRTCCGQVQRWVDAMIISTVLAVLAGVGVKTLGIVIRAAGHDSLERPGSVAFGRSAEFSEAQVGLMRLLFFFLALAMLLYLVAGMVVMVMAGYLVHTTVRGLAGRGVTATMLSEVRQSLTLHLLGMVAGIGTCYFAMVGALLGILNVYGTSALTDLATAILWMVDVAGDVAGVLLLSGIGELLFRDDPDTGDFNVRIRSLLRSTVLTSRAETVFEGSVLQTPNNMCVASFPGKFMEDWNDMTWLCEQHEMSSACVFLPTSDPGRRFGKHVQSPEDPKKQCWCYSLYGQEKPWGCLWFEIWRDNIEKAIDLGLDLVVVFFPGQVGEGLVDWEFLPTTDLWDGVGLGGSQKAEVAFLRRRGVEIVELDLQSARKLCLGRSRDIIAPPRRR